MASEQNQEKPIRAEQNAALKELGELAWGLGRRLRSLDTDTEWELIMALPTFTTNNRTDWITDFTDHVEDFAHAAEQALRAGKLKAGPRIPTQVQRTVERLASLYEERTGEPVSHILKC